MKSIPAALLAGLMVLAACDGDVADVPELKVASVTVSPGGRTLVIGETMQLTAYPKTADGTVLGGRRIDWSSEAAGVAMVMPNGTVIGAGPGTTRIVAAVEGRVGSVQVTVVAAELEVATIEIVNAPTRLEIGEQIMLEAVLKAGDGTVIGGRMVTWRTSHGPTATVDTDPNGTFALLSAHAAGSVTVTAEADGRSVSIAVLVAAPAAPVGSIVLSPSDADVWVGGNRIWEATVLTGTGAPHPNPPALTWSIDDPTVATVDANGRVLGLRPGTTHIRATADGVQGGAKLTVHAVLTGSQRFLLDAGTDPQGNAREVVLGELTWYGDSNEGEPAREILKSGAVTLETTGGSTKYTHQIHFDVVVGEGAAERKVGFGSITDTGTVETLYDQAGDAPGLWFKSSNAQNGAFVGRLEASDRLILRQVIAAAPLLEFLWVRE